MKIIKDENGIEWYELDETDPKDYPTDYVENLSAEEYEELFGKQR